jgi:multiple sugar transport system permease protein
MEMRRRNQFIKILSYTFLIITSFIMIYPVLFMVFGAFTTNDRFLDAVFLPVPNTTNFALFVAYLKAGLGRAYFVTTLRVIFYTLVTVGVGLIGGYIFSKMRFPGKNKVFILFLSGMVMPGILMMVPAFLMYAWFPLAGGNNILGQGGHGFIGDWPALFVGGWVPVFAIFLLKQSYDMLPTEYEDAAKMDGAGMFTIIFRVYGPLLMPPIVALIILGFLGTWNDYLWPAYTVSGNTEWQPIAYRMQYVQVSLVQYTLGVGTTDYPSLMVRTFIASWPPAVVYFLLQRYFVQGMVASGLKG